MGIAEQPSDRNALATGATPPFHLDVIFGVRPHDAAGPSIRVAAHSQSRAHSRRQKTEGSFGSGAAVDSTSSSPLITCWGFSSVITIQPAGMVWTWLPKKPCWVNAYGENFRQYLH